jgi:hypothetical protein
VLFNVRMRSCFHLLELRRGFSGNFGLKSLLKTVSDPWPSIAWRQLGHAGNFRFVSDRHFGPRTLAKGGSTRENWELQTTRAAVRAAVLIRHGKAQAVWPEELLADIVTAYTGLSTLPEKATFFRTLTDELGVEGILSSS